MLHILHASSYKSCYASFKYYNLSRHRQDYNGLVRSRDILMTNGGNEDNVITGHEPADMLAPIQVLHQTGQTLEGSLIQVCSVLFILLYILGTIHFCINVNLFLFCSKDLMQRA